MPGNPFRVQEDVVVAKLITEPFVEAITDAVLEDEIIAEIEEVVETAAENVSSEPEIVGVEDAMVAEADIDETENIATSLVKQ